MTSATPERRRYDKAGILALYPQAYWDYFVEVEDTSVQVVRENVAVVEIRGPLEHHDGWWADSYESILDRVADACAMSASTIVLKIDSPGGELLGCFDAARTIRARAKDAGKTLLAYVDGCACSAAYALACSAERIYSSDTAFLGSIGVLITRVDVTKWDANVGQQYTLVASGKRKVDGHPHAAMTPDELAASQAQCDALAAIFFELVASLRGVDAAAVAALEADIFHGADAVKARLADRVCTFDELLAEIAAGTGGPMADDNEESTEATTTASSDDEESTTASSEVDQAKALLEEAAKGVGEEAERARKALEELNGGGDDDDDDDDGETASSSSASSGKGRRVSAETAGGLAEIVARQGREIQALRRKSEKAERSALLAARPDLEKPLAAYLATKPLAEVQAFLKTMPKPAAGKPASTASVTGTRGKGQETTATSKAVNPDPGTAALDRAFGTGDSGGGVRREGTRQLFGIRPPKSQNAAATAGKVGDA